MAALKYKFHVQLSFVNEKLSFKFLCIALLSLFLSGYSMKWKVLGKIPSLKLLSSINLINDVLGSTCQRQPSKCEGVEKSRRRGSANPHVPLGLSSCQKRN